MKVATIGFLIVSITLIGQQCANAEPYVGGQSACRTWTDLRASNRAQPEMNWLHGYMLAAFDIQSVLAQHRNEFSADKVYAWIDQYCSQRPDQSVLMAARELVRSLAKSFAPPPGPK
jgi:hypothetical protein